MRKTDRLINAGLLTAIFGLVSILNIFAFRATQFTTSSGIQGVAYFDCNYNGLKEIGETSFPNMDVILTGFNSLGDTVTQITTTDGAGLYAFASIDAGTYRVKFTFPTGSSNLSFSPQNIGGDDGADSDPNAAGYTDALSIDGITDIGAVDAGVVDSVCPVIYYTHPLIASLLDGDTLTVGCDNIPSMGDTWARGVNNSGGADLPVDFERVLVRNGDCKEDGFVQFFVCTWTTENVCNHETQVRLYLKTVDTIPPTLTVPNDTTINLLASETVPVVPSSIPTNDNCSGTGSTINYRDSETPDACGKIIRRIWTAEDACGNQTIDTQVITIILNPFCDGAPSTDTVVIAPFKMSGSTKDTCLSAYLGSDRVLKNTWTLSSTDGVSAAVIGDSCLTLTRQTGFSGRDTIGGWHCDGTDADCRFFLLAVNILPDDPSCHLVATDTIIPMAVSCGSIGTYCLTSLNDINSFNNSYTVADNGATYNGSLNSCTKDTTFSYTYYTLPFMGLSGQYRLDYWRLNGSDVTIASFDSLPQLVDTMNVYDPTGNWAIDTATYTITGGTTANAYGQIKVTKLSNAAVGTAEVATNIADSGIQMAFTGGLHTVIFTKTLTGCTDTLNVNVYCDTILAPVAVNDISSTDKNTSVIINALANDTLNGVLISPLSIIGNPTNGTASVDGSNIITYTPGLNFCGSNDTIKYKICNADGCDTGWIFVSVNCPLAPNAVNDVTTTSKNVSITINPLVNDTLHGVLIEPVNLLYNPINGTASINGSNIISYTPALDFCGANDILGYEICNENGCDTAWVFIIVTCQAPVADPIALDDTVSTSKNTDISFSPLANDNLNGNLLILDILTISNHGTVGFISSDSLIYSPEADYCGNDTIQYRICRDDFICDTAYIYLTVTCPIPVVPPVALSDTISTDKNISVNIDALANDTTNGGLIQNARIIQNPTNGTAVVNAFNTIDYTPQLDFCDGTDTLSYEICNADGCDTATVIITVNCPVVVVSLDAADDAATTTKNTLVVIDVLNNDVTTSPLTRTPNIIKLPTKGTAAINFFNRIVYTPQLDFCGGNDTLTYEICNITGCDTATVILTVSCPINILPPAAVNDVASTDKNVSVNINPLANDNTNGGLTQTARIIQNPTKGTAIINASNTIDYTPQLDFCGGSDTLSYEICNANGCDTGWIFMTINCPVVVVSLDAVNDVATTTKNTLVVVDVLGNDVSTSPLTRTPNIVNSPSKGTAVVNFFNKIVYTPQLNFCGSNDTLSYEICNATGCDTATVIVTVNCPPPVYPVAVNDAVSTVKNANITIDALANDNTNGTLITPLSIVSNPTKGTVTINASNNIIYTPQLDFCGGNDTLSYKICNADGCDTATVIVTINCPPVPVYPIAISDAVSTDKNLSVNIDILANDNTNGGLTQNARIIQNPTKGTANVNAFNTIDYTPQLNFCGGTDTLSYEICNADGCDTAKVVITVNCPVVIVSLDAVNDAATTAKNTLVVIDVLANDVTSSPLTRSPNIIKSPTKGTAVINFFNKIVYTPQSNVCGGTDTLSYEICNATGCDTALVIVTVTCPATVYPIAIDDAVATDKNVGITINALANDNTNGPLSLPLSIINYIGNATVSVNGSNNIVYTPALNFCGGTDTLSYKICNADGCDTAKIIITVNCPVVVSLDAVNDAATTAKNTLVLIDVLANDVTSSPLTRTPTIIKSPTKGTAVVNFFNKIVYTPALNFCGGNDTLSYEICNAGGCDTATVIVTVTCPAAIYPIAIDEAVSTDKNVGITINALANDNINGTFIPPLSIVNYTGNATISVDGSNDIVYTPALNFCGGTDTLMYKICNADGCDTGWIFVTVNCPIILKPNAVDDIVSTDKNTVKLFKPTVNDILNGQLFALNIITTPTNGGVGFINIDSLIYTPNIGFCGIDTFRYSICNEGSLCDTATIIVTVNCNDTIGNNLLPIALNDAVTTIKNTPINIAVIANDSVNGALSQPLSIVGNPKHGTAVVNGNQITYTPALDFCGGSDTLSYIICNANGCDTGWAFITISCGGGNNNANQPVAVNDNVSTGRNTPFIFIPTINDIINGTLSSLNIITNSTHGTVAFAGIDSLVYYPQLGYCGNDTIVYSICNQASLCDTAIVIIEVRCDTVPVGNGELPVAIDDLATTLKNISVNISVLTNDTINGGLTKPLSITSNPSKGTAIVSGNDIIYTPAVDFCGGTDTLSYEICNANGCDTSWVFITVNCPVVLLKPNAVNDVAITSKNTLVVIDVLANDITNGTLTRTTNIIKYPSKGTAIINFTNKIVYIPEAGFCGNDTLSYEICNADGCDTALVFIDIQCIGGVPDAIDDVATVNKNVGTSISVLVNDAINGTLSNPLSILTQPTNGVAVVDRNNNIYYIPNQEFCGANDTLTYKICNVNGCDTAQLIITISCDFVVNRPDAVDDYASTLKNKAVNIEILTNDKINGVLDSIYIIGTPKHGLASLNGQKIYYQPDSIFCGSTDTVTYSICTSNGCDTAKIIVFVTCDTISTDRPDAIDDVINVTQGRSVTVVVLANDLLHGAALDYINVIEEPRHGSVGFDSFGNIIYTPDPTFCGGNDTLTYGICTQYGCDTAQLVITITCDSLFNSLPIANTDNAATARGISITIPVLQNDTLNGADTFRITTFANHGSAVFNSDNSIVYQPDFIFCNGKDTLVYEICNSNGCSSAKVIINITCDSIGILIPNATEDTITLTSTEPVVIDILNNDTLRGAKPPVIVTQSKKGTVTIMGDNKALYVPNANAFGRDTFSYVLCNAFGCDTVTVSIYIQSGDSLKIFNGFSPNNDGMNDRFVIKGIENYPDNEVYIYNRWGVEVFKIKGYNNDNGWDGSWIGKYLPDGTYFVIIILNDDKKQRKTGFIQIHR